MTMLFSTFQLAANYFRIVISSYKIWLLALCFLFIFCQNCSSTDSSQNIDSRFSAGIIKTLNAGYTDSIFITADGNRIYFLNSVLSAHDFISGTTNDPQAEYLPNHTGVGTGVYWNSDLYYMEWDDSSWSEAVNLGPKINTLGNEGCVWLNDDETKIIYYRDNLGLSGIGATGNYMATRSDRNSEWSDPVILPGKYGSEDQLPSSHHYRHDIQMTSSGDLYLWESQDGNSINNILLYGKWNGSTWNDPVTISGTHGDLLRGETQVWISRDEKKMVFNRRGADANTQLIFFSRENITDSWGNETIIPLNGFSDPAGFSVWG